MGTSHREGYCRNIQSLTVTDTEQMLLFKKENFQKTLDKSDLM